MKLLVDGVFFQLSNSGIARVWRSILPLLARRPGFEIIVLDRGQAPIIDGIRNVPFPAYTATYSADDSILIQRICDCFGVDVFTSTYYTTPLKTPMLLMVHDMIPELFDFDLSLRDWTEKDAAISYAQRYVCVSENTRNDLLSFYPEIREEAACVAHCGVDEAIFRVHAEHSVAAFAERYELDRPYFLFVGSRVQHNGYKNSALFFDAVSKLRTTDFDVFCVGGEKHIEESVLKKIPHGVRCRRMELTDEELSLAYNRAVALVYPSLYEGFGMPVIEAMSSGCPVITTRHGALAETAGEAACVVGGSSVEEMRNALERVRDPAYRASLTGAGIAHARRFRWEDMAEKVAGELVTLDSLARKGAYASFFLEWTRLRRIQASVDY